MARFLDGVSNLLINTAVSTAVVDNFTMSIWVKYTNFTTDDDTVFYNGNAGANGWGLYWQNSTGKMAILFGGVIYSGGAAYSTTGLWTCWTLRRLAGTAQLFKDGVAFGSSFATAPNVPSGVGVFIGESSGSSAANLPKTVAHAAIWEFAIGNDEITLLAAGVPPFLIRPANLALYWPLNGISSPELDWSGRAKHCTPTGTTYADGPVVRAPSGLYVPPGPGLWDAVIAGGGALVVPIPTMPLMGV